MPARWSRLVDLLLGLTAAACIALAGARTWHNISLHQPLQLVTSGAEEEALYSIWCVAHGQPVYTNPLALPYTASYFNWLFYAVYGSVSAAALHLFHLNDGWLPTICRILTLILASIGAGVFLLALRTSSMRLGILTAASLALIALFNPLSGLWLITARPDLGAATLELASLALFFRYARTREVGWIICTALVLDAAWSFKQTALSALAGVALTLLIARDVRGLLVLASMWIAGVALALVSLGPDYRHGLYLSQIHSGAQLRWGAEHFISAVAKLPFILAALAFLPWAASKHERSERWAMEETSVTLTMLFALALGAVTSCKGGAADYYFIPLAVFSVLWLAMAEHRLPRVGGGGALAALGGVMILSIAGVLLGWRGTLDCGDPRQPFEHLAAYLAQRPGPVFVQATYGDLPWISPTTPHFVVAYLYKPDRDAGVQFQQGGWENLMANGYFSTVVADVDTPGWEPIPPALLARYRLVREADGFRYFERK